MRQLRAAAEAANPRLAAVAVVLAAADLIGYGTLALQHRMVDTVMRENPANAAATIAFWNELVLNEGILPVSALVPNSIITGAPFNGKDDDTN